MSKGEWLAASGWDGAMPLHAFQSAQESADIRAAVIKRIGQQLRLVFDAELEASPSGRLAECLKRIEEREEFSRDPGGRAT